MAFFATTHGSFASGDTLRRVLVDSIKKQETATAGVCTTRSQRNVDAEVFGGLQTAPISPPSEIHPRDNVLTSTLLVTHGLDFDVFVQGRQLVVRHYNLKTLVHLADRVERRVGELTPNRRNDRPLLTLFVEPAYLDWERFSPQPVAERRLLRPTSPRVRRAKHALGLLLGRVRSESVGKGLFQRGLGILRRRGKRNAIKLGGLEFKLADFTDKLSGTKRNSAHAKHGIPILSAAHEPRTFAFVADQTHPLIKIQTINKRCCLGQRPSQVFLFLLLLFFTGCFQFLPPRIVKVL